jgi:hypothetical protein
MKCTHLAIVVNYRHTFLTSFLGENFVVTKELHEFMLETPHFSIIGGGGEADNLRVHVRGLQKEVNRVLHDDVVRLVDDYQAPLLFRDLVEANHELHTLIEVTVSTTNESMDVRHEVKVPLSESIT